MTEQEYEHHYRAMANVLSQEEIGVLSSAVAGIKRGDIYEKTPDGLYMIPVGEKGVLNKIVFTDGEYNAYSIEKIITIQADDETDLTDLRRIVYEGERNGVHTENSDLFKTHIGSYYSYDDFIGSIQKNKGNSSGERNGRGSSGEAETTRKVDFSIGGRGNGYDGYSMSNNARTAYANGEMPLSQWTKQAVIENIAESLGVEVDDIKLLKPYKEYLVQSSWHHTSKYYNKTNFYTVAYTVGEDIEISENGLKNIYEAQKKELLATIRDFEETAKKAKENLAKLKNIDFAKDVGIKTVEENGKKYKVLAPTDSFDRDIYSLFPQFWRNHKYTETAEDKFIIDKFKGEVRLAIEQAGREANQDKNISYFKREIEDLDTNGVRFSIGGNNNTEYTYEKLVAKPDMVVTELETLQNDDRNSIIARAKKNAKQIGEERGNGIVVKVKDTGENVIVSSDGLRHGLTRKLDDIGIVTISIGSILQNSIKINELVGARKDANSAYILIGVAKNDKNLYIVRSIVNRYTNNLENIDVLYAVNTKKDASVLNAPVAVPHVSAPFVISIADILDYVNRFYPDILPKNVYSHFSQGDRPNGDFTSALQFSLGDGKKDMASKGQRTKTHAKKFMLKNNKPVMVVSEINLFRTRHNDKKRISKRENLNGLQLPVDSLVANSNDSIIEPDEDVKQKYNFL